MYNQTKMYLWYQKQVVDARAGPGMKSMTKYKSKSKKQQKDDDKLEAKKKNFTREYSPALSDKSDGAAPDVEMAEVDFLCESATSARSSRTASPGGSDCDDNVSSLSSVNRRHKIAPKRRENIEELSEFVDTDFWKMYVEALRNFKLQIIQNYVLLQGERLLRNGIQGSLRRIADRWKIFKTVQRTFSSLQITTDD